MQHWKTLIVHDTAAQKFCWSELFGLKRQCFLNQNAGYSKTCNRCTNDFSWPWVVDCTARFAYVLLCFPVKLLLRHPISEYNTQLFSWKTDNSSFEGPAYPRVPFFMETLPHKSLRNKVGDTAWVKIVNNATNILVSRWKKQICGFQ